MPSISTINSSALNQNNAQQLSSTQQIGLSPFFKLHFTLFAVPRGGTHSSGRYRYTQNTRRSPIQVSSNRISPYNIPRRQQSNPRTPEPLPEAPADAREEDLRR